MKQLIITFLFTIFITINLGAQNFYPFKIAKENNETGIAGLQIAFEDWIKTQDISNLKVSKPFHRWMWFNQSRINPDDNIPLANYYQLAAKQINREKELHKNFSSNGWIPVGPFDIVPSPDTTSIHDIGRLNCIAFHPSDSSIFWVGAPQGGIWKTMDGGQNWMPLGDNLPIMRISDIAVDPNDPDVMYICIGDYGYLGFFTLYAGRPTHYGLGVYKTTDGGNSWEPTGLSFQIENGMYSLLRRVFINPENTSELIAAGTNGIYKSSDAGENWQRTDTRFIWDFEMQPDNYKVIYATTFGLFGGISSVIKSDDFGNTWQVLNTGIPANDTIIRIEVTVAPSDTNFIYAACSGYDDAFYAFYQSTDAGQTWTKQADSSQINIFGQINGDPNNKLAQASYDLWVWVDPDDPERVFTGAMNIWGSEDGGQNWDICSFGLYFFGRDIHFDHHFVKQNPLDEKIYFCCDGGLYRTDSIPMGNLSQFDSCLNVGNLTPDCYKFETEWENLSSGLVITEFYRLGLSKNIPGWVLAGSQDNCTFYKNDMEDWINLTNGDGMESMIEPDNTDVLYMANQFGYLLKSTNGGQTLSSNYLTLSIMNQEGLGVWVTPFVMDQENPNTIFCGFGNVWKSDQGGYGWYKISDFSNMPGYDIPKPIWDIALAPGNSNIIYVSKQPYPLAGIQYSGEFWRTNDGGENWENITFGLPSFNSYINDISIAENPDVVFVSCTGFEDGKKVYKTINGGQDWENISGSLPNLPVSTVVYQLFSEKHDVYIGTDLGIYHLNDDYVDWQLFSENLPNVIICELEIDYNESNLYAATYGRGIWMTELINPVVGIEENQLDFEASFLEIYPNPSNGKFCLEINSDFIGELNVSIIDILGSTVNKRNLQISETKSVWNFDISDKPSGVYFIKVGNGERSKVCKFFVE